MLRDAVRNSAPLFRPDPGWLFLLAGLALLAATTLIPAHDDLAKAQLALARAEASRAHAAERVANYASYLDALERGEPTLAISLAARHLNMAPEGVIVATAAGRSPTEPIDTFQRLEPPPPKPLVRTQPDTILQRWTTNDRSRLWCIAAGAVLVLIGLLPMGSDSKRD